MKITFNTLNKQSQSNTIQSISIVKLNNLLLKVGIEFSTIQLV